MERFLAAHEECDSDFAALPWWVPNAYILVVIVLGVVLIAAGLLVRDDRDPVLIGGQRAEAPATTADAPRAGPGPAAAGARPLAPGPAKEKVKEEKAGGGADGKAKDRRLPDLDTVTVLNRFAIGVPPGWLRGLSGGAVVFRHPSERAELRVFLELGDERPRALSREAVNFLAREHPDAKISRPRRIRLRGVPAMRLVAKYDGGAEEAALLSVSGYSYLLLSRVDKGVSRPTRTAAVAALYSFNPL